MTMEPVHEETMAGISIKIYPDSDSQSADPLEWDRLGTMVCFHKRYNLGDKHSLRSDDFNGWGEIADYLRKEKNAVVLLPLYLMDHSGLSMHTSPGAFMACDAAGWDWGCIGFIYATRADILKEYGGKIITKKNRERAEACLHSEVKAYDDYLRGEVYGYEVTDGGEIDDSCWGFLGEMEYCLEEARISAKYYVEQRQRALAETMALAHMS